jgi:hypothetical protein
MNNLLYMTLCTFKRISHLVKSSRLPLLYTSKVSLCQLVQSVLFFVKKKVMFFPPKLTTLFFC